MTKKQYELLGRLFEREFKKGDSQSRSPSIVKFKKKKKLHTTLKPNLDLPLTPQETVMSQRTSLQRAKLQERLNIPTTGRAPTLPTQTSTESFADARRLEKLHSCMHDYAQSAIAAQRACRYSKRRDAQENANEWKSRDKRFKQHAGGSSSWMDQFRAGLNNRIKDVLADKKAYDDFKEEMDTLKQRIASEKEEKNREISNKIAQSQQMRLQQQLAGSPSGTRRSFLDFKIDKARSKREQLEMDHQKLKIVQALKSRLVSEYRQLETDKALKLGMLRRNIVKMIKIIWQHLLIHRLHRNFKTMKKIR